MMCNLVDIFYIIVYICLNWILADEMRVFLRTEDDYLAAIWPNQKINYEV